MTVLRQLPFFALVLALWGGAHYYVGRRLIPRSLATAPRRLAWAVLWAIASVPMIAFFAGFASAGQRGPLTWTGFLVMGLSTLLVTLTLALDAGRWLTRRIARRSIVDPGRRAFLGRVATLGGAGGLTTIGYLEAIRLPRLVEVDVPIAGLAPELEGFRIAQLSDVHVGPTIGRAYLEGLVEIVNGQSPDLIALTGDMVDGWVEAMRDEVAPFSSLRARHGCFFVTGNHEYYWDGPAWCEEFRRLGAEVLINEHRVIDHEGAALVIAGVTDRSGGARAPEHETSPQDAVAGAPAGAPIVMLAHQPRSAAPVAATGAALMLSGHTHGGQYFPLNLLVHLFQPYVAGLHLLEETWIYVSRGSGYWGPPNRFGAPSEVTLLRLRRA
ncbi:MAG: metallophosphoesterase [Myxococcales bacterium]|nr:metallophosphoesterase [Myxococcales bacterium]